MSRYEEGPTIWKRPDTETLYILYRFWCEVRLKRVQRRHRVGRNLKEARVALAKAQVALDQGRDPFPRGERKMPQTLGSFLDKYLIWSKGANSKKTYENDHKPRLTKLINHLGASRSISSIGQDEIEGYKALRMEEASAWTSFGEVKSARAFFRKAVEWRCLKFSPAASVRLPKVPEKVPEYLRKVEVEVLIAGSTGTKSHLVIALGALAGLRKQEIEWLTWDDVDFELSLIHVRSKPGWRTKTGKAWTVPLSRRLASLLKSQSRISRWVVPNRNGSRYRSNMLKDFKKVAKSLGIERRVWLHLLRDTFATLQFLEGVQIKKISKWLGHASVTTTERYTHVLGYDEDIEKY